jgi:hypothetical protein
MHNFALFDDQKEIIEPYLLTLSTRSRDPRGELPQSSSKG